MVVTRVRMAFLVAPLVAVVAAWAGAWLLAAWFLAEPVRAADAGHAFFVLAFFGAPLAYAVAALAGVPLVGWLRRTGRLRLGPLALLGAAAGAAGFTAAWAGFWGAAAVAPAIPAVGAAAGALTAAAFWALGVAGRRRSASRPAA